MLIQHCKDFEIWHTINTVSVLKIKLWFYNSLINTKLRKKVGMASSVDHDQTALGAVQNSR